MRTETQGNRVRRPVLSSPFLSRSARRGKKHSDGASEVLIQQKLAPWGLSGAHEGDLGVFSHTQPPKVGSPNLWVRKWSIKQPDQGHCDSKWWPAA